MKHTGWLLVMLVLFALSGCSRATVPEPPGEQVSIVAVRNPPPLQVFEGAYFYKRVDEVEVTYSDGSSAMLPVIWDDASLSATGIQADTVLYGKLPDINIKAEQVISVMSKVLQVDDQGLTDENWEELVEEKLKNLPVVYRFSPDRTQLVYAVETVGTDLFLWAKGQPAACLADLRNDLYHSVEWSSDSDFFFAIASTDVNVGVYVLDARNNKIVAGLGSFMGASWSPAGREILIARTTSVKIIKDIGDGLAYEIAVHNVDSGETTVLVPGQPDCLFFAEGWKDPDTVLYSREDLNTGKAERHLEVNIPR